MIQGVINVIISICYRRSSTYTHRPYSSKSMADVDETLLPSQETIYDEILSPTRDDVLPHANVVNHSPSVVLSGG